MNEIQIGKFNGKNIFVVLQADLAGIGYGPFQQGTTAIGLFIVNAFVEDEKISKYNVGFYIPGCSFFRVDDIKSVRTSEKQLSAACPHDGFFIEFLTLQTIKFIVIIKRVPKGITDRIQCNCKF